MPAVVAILTGEPAARLAVSSWSTSGYPVLCVGEDFAATDAGVISPGRGTLTSAHDDAVRLRLDP